MDLSRALADLAEIHGHLAKGEIYRGYRPVPVAASGLIGLAAAWLEAPGLGSNDPMGFVRYWSVVAIVAALVGTSEIIYNYAVRDDAAARRQTRRVVGQFLPSVLGAAIITFCFVRWTLAAGGIPAGSEDPALLAQLPGVWAICFGLGTFASRPYLPRASTTVAVFYYAAGVALLWNARGDALNGWWVGGTFGIGQLMAAAVLYAGSDALDAGSKDPAPREGGGGDQVYEDDEAEEE
jgi:hypothetical protein